MRAVRLGEICDVIVGRTPPRADPSLWGEDAPWVSIADMNQGLSIASTKERISAAGAAKGKLITAGTVLLSFKLSIGKVARAAVPLYTNEAIAALPVKDPASVDEAYLLRALQAQDLTGGSNRAAMGATLNKAALQAIPLPLPPLEEQRRIASILDQADAIRAKRRQVIQRLDGLKGVLVEEGLGGTGQMVSLAEISDIQSGITKGRRAVGSTCSVPYLAVANVQAGRLDLSEVKLIEATEKERRKYRLQDGDLVLTEGGDPDKLGRGTVWREELPECLHQNHIFRVRLAEDSGVAPELVAAHLTSLRAKDYFLRAAKQTTGIASINKTQLSRLPVPVLDQGSQERLLKNLAEVDAAARTASRALAKDDELFASLQSRAFRGEL